MLKQPLLSRMFKLKEAADVPVESNDLAVLSEDNAATLLEEKRAEQTAIERSDSARSDSESLDSEILDSEILDSEILDSEGSDPQKPSEPRQSDANTALLEKPATVAALAETSVDSVALDDSTDKNKAEQPLAKATLPQAEPLAGKVSRKLKLPKVTTTRAVIALGALAAVAGAVVPRAVSPTFRAEIAASVTDKLAGPVAPVSDSDDLAVESLVTTGNLFVTNQILYRKLEAIAGVTLVNPEDRVAPTLPVPSATTADPAAKITDGKPAGSNPAASATTATGTDNKNDSATDKEDAAKPDPDVNVTAAAPPVPIADPVVFTGTTIDSVLEMRVAVAKDVSGIGFATSGNGVITDLDGNELKALSPETGVLAEDAGGLVVDGETMPSAFWVYPEDGGYVAVGDSWYRGRMLIAQRERGLIAVNYVLLGDYLYSVVGTEVSPDWPMESLKAQAIAARSYALTHNIHPASEDYFDLDNTQRFQAYKGISREAATTQAAVQATAGEFISHEGGIVESLYAASQAIVDDAHKGAGMSQLGAKDLAAQGYSYQEILAHYYPGTALGRLETDQE